MVRRGRPLGGRWNILERLGLSLNEAKTHIVDATQASFNFLGFTIQMSQGASTGKPYPSRFTGQASQLFGLVAWTT